MSNQSQQTHAWHALDLSSLEQALDATSGGLSRSEATARLGNFGPNVLPHALPPTWWQIALRQFRSPLIYILGVAAVVSVAIGEPIDAAFIAFSESADLRQQKATKPDANSVVSKRDNVACLLFLLCVTPWMRISSRRFLARSS